MSPVTVSELIRRGVAAFIAVGFAVLIAGQGSAETVESPADLPDGVRFSNALSESIVRAYIKSPSILSQLGEIDAARQSVKSAEQSRYVRLTGTGRGTGQVIWTRNRFFSSSLSERANPVSIELSVRAQKPVYDRSLDVGVRQARQSVLSQIVGLDTRVDQLVNQVAGVYASTYYNIQIEQLYEDAVENLEGLLEASRQRFEVGQITRVEVAEARAELASQRSDLISVRANVGNNLKLLDQLTGRVYSREDFDVIPTLEDLPVIVSADNAVEMANDRNPAVREARELVEISRLAVERAEVDRYVKFNLVGEAKQQIPMTLATNPGSFVTTLSLSLQSSVDLYDGGVGGSKVRNALSRYQISLSNLRNALDTAEQSAVSNTDILASRQEQIEAAESEVEAYTLALDGIQASERAGSKSLSDVLTATRRLLLSRIRLSNSKYSLFAQLLTSMRSVGAFDLAYVSGLSSGLVQIPTLEGSEDSSSSGIQWGDRRFREHTIPSPLER